MADRLTQLQTSLDQLLTQMFATVRYIDTHHPYSLIPNQPDRNPFSADNDAVPQNDPTQDPKTMEFDKDGNRRPDAPLVFHARLQELAQDLVLKEQQVEVLIESLPGLGNSQAQQEEKIRKLQEELQGLGKEREQAAKEKEELLRRVEGRILGVRRV